MLSKAVISKSIYATIRETKKWIPSSCKYSDQERYPHMIHQFSNRFVVALNAMRADIKPCLLQTISSGDSIYFTSIELLVEPSTLC